MRLWVIAAVTLVLAGCTISDLNFGSSGGLVSEQMTTDIFGIKSNPNASTEDVLLKAAQTTKSIGASHFKLISADDAGRPLDVGSPGAASAPAAAATGSAASATIRPGCALGSGAAWMLGASIWSKQRRAANLRRCASL